MYIIVKDPITQQQKVILSPVYSAYEFITPYDVRYNDDEWRKQMKNYQQINLKKVE